MRFGTAVLCGAVVAASFGGGLLIGTDIGKEPETVTMAAPETEENIFTENPPAPVAVPPTPTPVATPKEEYLLTLSGKSICIYALLADGKTELIQKTEVDTGQLRQEDYESLCRGLKVESLEKARSLCEDFGS